MHDYEGHVEAVEADLEYWRTKCSTAGFHRMIDRRAAFALDRYLDRTAPRDGTVLTLFNPGIMTESIINPSEAKMNFSGMDSGAMTGTESLTQAQQLRFASRFGPLGERRPPPKAIASRTEGVLQTDNRVLLVSNIKVDGQPIGAFGDADMWFHIDGGYSERPYQYSLLYSVELPSSGGNTLFSNMYKAYDAVPAPLKQRLAAKKALHIHEYKRAEKLAIKEDLSGSPHFFHPVFVTHPNTGRKTLFVDRLMTQRIEGVSLLESDETLEQLYEIGERPEFVYEHVWKLGDLVCWDNRCTIHARTPFPKGENRLMRRCTVEGPPIRE
jgi:taurine dioxygenase